MRDEPGPARRDVRDALRELGFLLRRERLAESRYANVKLQIV